MFDVSQVIKSTLTFSSSTFQFADVDSRFIPLETQSCPSFKFEWLPIISSVVFQVLRVEIGAL